jgi:hypothetical protein
LVSIDEWDDWQSQLERLQSFVECHVPSFCSKDLTERYEVAGTELQAFLRQSSSASYHSENCNEELGQTSGTQSPSLSLDHRFPSAISSLDTFHQRWQKVCEHMLTEQETVEFHFRLERHLLSNRNIIEPKVPSSDGPDSQIKWTVDGEMALVNLMRNIGLESRERWSQRYDLASDKKWIKDEMTPSNPLILQSACADGTPWHGDFAISSGEPPCVPVGAERKSTIIKTSDIQTPALTEENSMLF